MPDGGVAVGASCTPEAKREDATLTEGDRRCYSDIPDPVLAVGGTAGTAYEGGCYIHSRAIPANH